MGGCSFMTSTASWSIRRKHHNLLPFPKGRKEALKIHKNKIKRRDNTRGVISPFFFFKWEHAKILSLFRERIKLFQNSNQTLSTLPARRQREHTATVLWVPFTTALTFLMLGFHVLLVLRLEWETLLPNVTPFPQYIHFAIFLHLPWMFGLSQTNGYTSVYELS